MQVRLIDLIGVLSRALDLVSSTLGKHHAHVGCLAARVAGYMKMPPALQRDVLFAGMLHDAGAVALHTSLESLLFEKDLHTHGRAGELLFSRCAGMENVARIIGEHHTPWTVLRRYEDQGFARAAAIINFVDFVDVRLKRDTPYADQFGSILSLARKESGRMLDPECIAVFEGMLARPHMLDGLFAPERSLFTDCAERHEQVVLNAYDVVGLCAPFAQVIDFRSRFTATHSRGVAVVGQELARLFGFEVNEIHTMYVAGLLHDIGKLAVPNKLLEKPGQLTCEEFSCVQEHALVSEHILGGVPGLELVCEWAVRHHERLDGSGYPHGYADTRLSLGSRILQVADVFTAIMEDRPYRMGMTMEAARDVLTGQAAKGQLDAEVVRMLLLHADRVNSTRHREQCRAREEFEEFSAAVRCLGARCAASDNE